MDFQRWALFREVDSSLISKCKFASIMIRSLRVGFIVLENDDVYAVTNAAGSFRWLGNGLNYTGAVVNQASKVEPLCGKSIIGFYSSRYNISALSKDGCVYTWSSDEYGPPVDGIIRRALLSESDKIQAHQVVCGDYHTLCLTSDGKVFGWGFNDLGQLGRGGTCEDDWDGNVDVGQVSGLSDSIVQVAAGNETSYALDSLGRVWSWGLWESSSLGYEASENQVTPKLIENLPKIKKIAAGFSHVLALSERGELYFWGRFDKFDDYRDGSEEYDKIDDGQVIINPLVIKMSEEIVEPVTDIASTVEAKYAVCQVKNKVYVWGMWFQKHIPKPKATEFSSMEEVFACAESPIMLHPIRVKERPQRVADVWKRAFNDQSTADVLFSVENTMLHAHSVFLKLRSDYFRRMFDNGWEESKKESRAINIEGFSFRIFKAFIYFLYNESLIEPDMSLDDLTELMKAADYYGNEDLLFACENKLKTHLAPENACSVYTSAVQFNAQNLKDYTAGYVVSVLKQVVKSTGFAEMDSGVKRKLINYFSDRDLSGVLKKRRLL